MVPRTHSKEKRLHMITHFVILALCRWRQQIPGAHCPARLARLVSGTSNNKVDSAQGIGPQVDPCPPYTGTHTCISTKTITHTHTKKIYRYLANTEIYPKCKRECNRKLMRVIRNTQKYDHLYIVYVIIF